MNIKTNLKNHVFFPGNVVEGFVEITTTSDISMVAVRCKATGKEKVVCRRRRKQGKRHYTETCRESHPFYKQLITLAGQMKSSGQRQSIEVPPGQYTYPFAFQLPMDIPASFAKSAGDDYAAVVYYVKAYVDIPYGRDAVSKQLITVIKPMPMRQWVHHAPCHVESTWDVKMCCCIDKGTVKGRIFMDRSMIAIDRDNLVVCADIDNTNGKEPVNALEVSLINFLKYKAKHMTERNRVREGHVFIRNVQIPPGQKGRIAGVIPLPRGLVPTMNLWCVSSSYFIDIELDIPWATDPKQTFPVIIGQTVDETDFAPDIPFQENRYQHIGKQYQEFYYQPPPQPVYQVNTIPAPVPQGANLWNVQLQPQMPLPSTAWGGQVNDQQHPLQQSATGFHWNPGYEQNQLPPSYPTEPNIAMGPDAFGQPLYGDVSSPIPPQQHQQQFQHPPHQQPHDPYGDPAPKAL